LNLKLLFAIFVALLLIGAVVADARGGGSSGGGRSSGSHSFSKPSAVRSHVSAPHAAVSSAPQKVSLSKPVKAAQPAPQKNTAVPAPKAASQPPTKTVPAQKPHSSGWFMPLALGWWMGSSGGDSSDDHAGSPVTVVEGRQTEEAPGLPGIVAIGVMLLAWGMRRRA